MLHFDSACPSSFFFFYKPEYVFDTRKPQDIFHSSLDQLGGLRAALHFDCVIDFTAGVNSTK